MTNLLLVRHGETFDNANHIMQGQTQGELNDNGIQQAEQLADSLASRTVDAVMSSDLHRAVATAEIIARKHHLAVVTTPLLRERDWGGFTGCYIPDLKDAKWPDDIETIEALKNRARQFLNLVAQLYPNKTVVAVGHGIINKAVQAVYWNKEMPEVPRMANAEIRELQL